MGSREADNRAWGGERLSGSVPSALRKLLCRGRGGGSGEVDPLMPLVKLLLLLLLLPSAVTWLRPLSWYCCCFDYLLIVDGSGGVLDACGFVLIVDGGGGGVLATCGFVLKVDCGGVGNRPF